MVRVLGPDPTSRLVLRVNNGPFVRPAPGRTVRITTDEAGVTPADILAYQPLNPATPGSAITGGTVTLDDRSVLPLFWFPEDATELFVQVPGGGPVPVTGGGLTASNPTLVDTKLVVVNQASNGAVGIRATGSAIDYDIHGDLVFSAWQDFDAETGMFSGTQSNNMRLRADGGVTLVKRTEFSAGAYGAESYINPGVEALVGGKNASDPMKLCGLQKHTGEPAGGWADVDDVVLTLSGWYVCTVAGDPGTWTKCA